MRENYPTTHKLGSPMAHYLYTALLMNGDNGDEDYANEAWGDGAVRYGRRLLFWDGQGFVDAMTYPTPELASKALNWGRDDLYEEEEITL